MTHSLYTLQQAFWSAVIVATAQYHDFAPVIQCLAAMQSFGYNSSRSQHSNHAAVVCFTAVDPRRHKRQKQEVKEVKPLPKFDPFRPTKAMAFDLFPHTAHVEAVMLFERD